tara:strand:+ start:1412 stop:1555 length:144 start_codon:yes stop_codon:yes gene_type:complete
MNEPKQPNRFYKLPDGTRVPAAEYEEPGVQTNSEEAPQTPTEEESED